MSKGASNDGAVFSAYTTKEIDFRYRGIDLNLALSHGLFSSADVDAGSRLLLKVVSRLIDDDLAAGRPLPKSLLDAGSGVGVLGIAVARALEAAGNRELVVRAQDRDELARVFSAQNALRNGLEPNRFVAFAEKMLGGPKDAGYDLILSNLPAKTGAPVLANFFTQAGRMISKSGKGAVVIVNTLADLSRVWMHDAAVPILAEERGSEHTVFAFGAGDAIPSESDPYIRAENDLELEKTRYSIRAIHGVADFSEPSRAVTAAAKLAEKLGRFDRVLVHECEQGHFPVYLAEVAKAAGCPIAEVALCGRNVLALEASLFNVERASPKSTVVESFPVADLGLCAGEALGGRTFNLVASFPDIVPRTDRFPDTWLGAAKLTEKGGYFLISVASSDAARFDKLKTGDFIRAGDFKRDGFRALAYRRT